MSERALGASRDDWDHFDLVLGLGDDLLPVVCNYAADISPGSAVTDKGKTPSDYNAKRQIRGLAEWTTRAITDADLARWRREADFGICVRTKAVRGLDVDITDAALAERVRVFIAARLGLDLPRRARANSSKFLHAFYLAGEYGKRVIHVGEKQQIEFLMTGQQFVAVGTHQSGARYEWDGGLPLRIPELTAQQFEGLFTSLQAEFGIKEPTIAGVSRRIKGAHLDLADRVVAHLDAEELILGENRDGGLIVRCPWEHEHTMGEAGDGRSVYYPAGTNGESQPGFKCLHGHCAHRKLPDFLEAVGYVDDCSDEFDALPPPSADDEAAQALIRKGNAAKAARLAQAAIAKAKALTLDEILQRIADDDIVPVPAGQLAAEVITELVTARLGTVEEESALKALKDATGVSLKALRTDLAKARRKGPGGDVAAVSAEWPVPTARAFLQGRYMRGGEPTLRHWQDEFLMWDGVRYQAASNADMRAQIYALFERHRVDLPGRGPVDNTLDALKALANVPSTRTMPSWLCAIEPAPAGEVIPMRNGLLHVPTRSLLENTPSFFTAGSVDVAYAPSAPRPVTWLKFLADAFPGDAESVEALQQWFGYLLTQDTTQQKALICVGPKRCGKGTIARVLRALLGEHNCTGPSLGQLGGRFGLQGLIGKAVAIISDARVGGASDLQAISENLLRITGEDGISVERKNMTDWEGKLTTRFVLMTNILPGIVDAGGAVASRFIVLRFTQSFFGREDSKLTEKLMAELPGILNWALDGLTKLHDRGAFLQPASGTAAVEELIRKTTPILGFVSDALEYDPDAWISKDALYAAYRAWCEDEGMRFTLQKNAFLAELYVNSDGRLAACEPRAKSGANKGKPVKAVRGARLAPGWADRIAMLESHTEGRLAGSPEGAGLA